MTQAAQERLVAAVAAETDVVTVSTAIHTLTLQQVIGGLYRAPRTVLGVPGFNPIQDYVNYDVRTHYTNMDTVERLDEKDIQQAAIVIAWFAYNAATLERKIPLK